MNAEPPLRITRKIPWRDSSARRCRTIFPSRARGGGLSARVVARPSPKYRVPHRAFARRRWRVQQKELFAISDDAAVLVVPARALVWCCGPWYVICYCACLVNDKAELGLMQSMVG
jgi:hypothetical protein